MQNLKKNWLVLWKNEEKWHEEISKFSPEHVRKPKNDDVYIPFDLRKGTIFCFHIDNSDFAEDMERGRLMW